MAAHLSHIESLLNLTSDELGEQADLRSILLGESVG
jgi:hypothetical protein